jgi:hypothetical protein
MNRSLALGVLLCLPTTVWGDMFFPGFTRVPREVMIELSENAKDYHFWFSANGKFETLPLVPGQPFQIGQGRTGSYRFGELIAVPRRLVEARGEEELLREIKANKNVDGVMHFSSEFDFREEVPFYDSRDRVIDWYRVEADPEKGLRLVWLKQNTDESMRGVWAVTGVFASSLAVWLGWRWSRRNTPTVETPLPSS